MMPVVMKIGVAIANVCNRARTRNILISGGGPLY